MKTKRTETLISLTEFCHSHNIKISFINSLREIGLIEVITLNETTYIDINEVYQLEKMVRFHFDMDINIEGIETITHLLQKINTMQNEITTLRNRLRMYELNE